MPLSLLSPLPGMPSLFLGLANATSSLVLLPAQLGQIQGFQEGSLSFLLGTPRMPLDPLQWYSTQSGNRLLPKDQDLLGSLCLGPGARPGTKLVSRGV